MSPTKMPMSTGYKAVFALSILMIFVVTIGGSMSGSKSVGFGMLYWGYTAWKMYKRDNDALILLQRIVLWFEAIAFAIALAVLIFSDSDVTRLVDVTPLGLIIIATLSMGVTYLLYIFFKGQKNIGSTSALFGSNSSIDDRFWEQASRELEGDRHEATWARAFSNAEGDESKAKALYLNYRALALNTDRSVNFIAASTDNPGARNLSFFASLGAGGKLVLLFIVLLSSFLLIYSVKDFDQQKIVLSTDSSNPTVTQPSVSVGSSPVAEPDIPSSPKPTNQSNPPPTTRYISVYTSDKRAAGLTSGHSTQKEADSVARSSCKTFAKDDGDTCKKWIGKAANCIAVARGSNGAFGASWGDDESVLIESSIRHCVEAGGIECQLAGSQCSNN